MQEQRIAVEWLILGDAAQVVGNKLYLLGGGWDVITANRALPLAHPMALAVSFRVPYSETNRPFHFELEIQDADGLTLWSMGGAAEVGRPAGLPAGQAQRTQIAVNLVLELPRPGTYVVVGRVAGEETECRAPFNVVLGVTLPRFPG